MSSSKNVLSTSEGSSKLNPVRSNPLLKSRKNPTFGNMVSSCIDVQSTKQLSRKSFNNVVSFNLGAASIKTLIFTMRYSIASVLTSSHCSFETSGCAYKTSYFNASFCFVEAVVFFLLFVVVVSFFCFATS